MRNTVVGVVDEMVFGRPTYSRSMREKPTSVNEVTLSLSLTVIFDSRLMSVPLDCDS